MIELDLLSFQGQLQIKKEEGKRFLFDPIRKKWLVLLPEELVRQLMLCYLIQTKQYNKNRIRVEMGLQVNTLQKRCDILIYDQEMSPFLLVECKAPTVPIDQTTFRQIANYNLPLKVPYLLVTNGLATYCCRMNYEKNDFEFVKAVPAY